MGAVIITKPFTNTSDHIREIKWLESMMTEQQTLQCNFRIDLSKDRNDIEPSWLIDYIFSDPDLAILFKLSF